MYWVKIHIDSQLTLSLHFAMPMLQEDEDNYTVTSLSNAAMAYHVDMAVSCCTCPAGIMGGHCKHQSAVARMVGHNDSFFFCSSPETRKLYYRIATGEFLYIIALYLPLSFQVQVYLYV